MKRLFSFALTALAVVACSPQGQTGEERELDRNLLSSVDTSHYTRTEDAQIAMANVAEGLASDLTSLVESASKKRAKKNMGALVDVDYNTNQGYGENLGDLVSLSGYTLKVRGTRPSAPMPVSVHAKNQPVRAVIQTIAYQVRNQADIVIDDKHRTVELHYKPQ